MHLLRLQAEQLRLFEAVELEPAPGLNLLLGDNGAGKTSLLEAIHLLGYGRSFRTGAREALVRRGAERLRVMATLSSFDGRAHRVGLARNGRQWQARVDGADVGTLGDLFARCPVVCFEPGSHELIAGPSELRRRFLDWGLFHVEPGFLPVWRVYQRALRQRNAALRAGADAAELSAWEPELAASGEQLHRLREAYVDALAAPLNEVAAAVFPGPGAPELRYQPGWAVEQGLADALMAARPRDSGLGHTTVGPHRAGWSLRYPALPGRELLSRGQEKLSALCCVLAQARQFATVKGHWPVLLVDDLGSELDARHQTLAAAWLRAQPAQAWITGTVAPAGLALKDGLATFHVEQGRVTRLL